jgi:ADP-heptose:LPS heptosyltransferase
VRHANYEVTEVTAESAAQVIGKGGLKDCRMLVWKGGIGAWAGLIAASDELIGYDSASQHIAAALRVPLIDIFIEQSTAKFRSRWRPAGRGPITIIDRAGKTIDPSQLVDDVMKARISRK